MFATISKEKRANFYKLLADCYYLPDESLMKRIESSKKLAGQWEDIEILKVDFAKLFVGPFQLLASPYASVYLDKNQAIMGESTVDVSKRYQEEGLEINIKEVPDHIAIELEFMYFLIFKEIGAANKHNEANQYLQKQASFLSMHLGRWIEKFAANVQREAQTSFYKNLAKVTRLFIEEELEYYAEFSM